MSLGCKATAGAVILKQLEIACFHIINLLLASSFGGRGSEDGPLKDDGLGSPLGVGNSWSSCHGRGGLHPPFRELTKPVSGKCLGQR